MEAISSDAYTLKAHPKYVNKVVTPTLEPITGIEGYRILPDYSFETMPKEFSAIILIGGFGWSLPIAEKVTPRIKSSIANNNPVGAICNAASFMDSKTF